MHWTPEERVGKVVRREMIMKKGVVGEVTVENGRIRKQE